MIQEIHQAQHKLNLPEIVQSTACGAASIVQTLNYFEIPYESAEKVFWDFVFTGRYSRKIISLEFEGWEDFKIPFDFLSPGEDDREGLDRVGEWREKKGVEEKFRAFVEERKSKGYLPTFLLRFGSDSRGIRRFLGKKGLGAVLYEFKTKSVLETSENRNHRIYLQGKDLVEMALKELDKDRFLICSVEKGKIPYLKKVSEKIYGAESAELSETHLVTVKSILGKIYFIDPMIEDSEDALQEVKKDVFARALAGDRCSGHFISIVR